MLFCAAEFSQDFEFIFCFISNEVYKEEWERSDSRYPNEKKTKNKPKAEENSSFKGTLSEQRERNNNQ